MYLWPLAARADNEPLRPRLMRVGGRKNGIYLLTTVLDPTRLSRKRAGELYRMRRGVEMFYRSIKQIMGKGQNGQPHAGAGSAGTQLDDRRRGGAGAAERARAAEAADRSIALEFRRRVAGCAKRTPRRTPWPRPATPRARHTTGRGGVTIL